MSLWRKVRTQNGEVFRLAEVDLNAATNGVPTGGTAGQVLTKNSSTNYDESWATPTTYTDEQVRDVIGAALVAGTGMTITANDAGDTITLTSASGGFPISYDDGDSTYEIVADESNSNVLEIRAYETADPTDYARVRFGAESAGSKSVTFSVVEGATEGDLQLYVDAGATPAGQLLLRFQGNALIDARRVGAANRLGLFGATPVVQQTHITDPSGGVVQDAESRTAIIAILDLLEAYGLMAP